MSLFQDGAVGARMIQASAHVRLGGGGAVKLLLSALTWSLPKKKNSYLITTDYVNKHAADMIVFLIHRSRAKAGALSVGHTLSLRPKLGKVVNRDAQIQLLPFASSPPLHASFCINYH
jgi:hypothetical protein